MSRRRADSVRLHQTQMLDIKQSDQFVHIRLELFQIEVQIILENIVHYITYRRM